MKASFYYRPHTYCEESHHHARHGLDNLHVQVEREQAGELERSGQVQGSLDKAQARLKAVKGSLKGLEGRVAAAASKLQKGMCALTAQKSSSEQHAPIVNPRTVKNPRSSGRGQPKGLGGAGGHSCLEAG